MVVKGAPGGEDLVYVNVLTLIDPRVSAYAVLIMQFEETGAGSLAKSTVIYH